MMHLRKAAGILGIFLSYSYPLLPSLAATDTCTMGGPDGYLASTILASLILLISAPLIMQLQRMETRIWLILLGHIATAVYFSISVVPVLWRSSVRGVHICGADFGAADTLEQFLYAPVLLTGLAFFLYWPLKESIASVRRLQRY